jgi:MerC mercury resistance protein
MIESLFQRSILDRLAIGLSGLCAVHCVVTALLLGAMSSLGHLFTSPLIHEGGLAMAILLGAAALYAGAMRHGRLLPTALGSLGLGMMAGALNLPHGESEVVYTVAGVTIVALGHWFNHQAGRNSTSPATI